MIPGEPIWFLFTLCTLLSATAIEIQGGRAYDTNDWIPVTPSQLRASASELVEQKTASDRLLSLDVPAQKFFPDEEYEYRKRRPSQGPQFLRDIPVKKGIEPPRPRKLKHSSAYQYETPPPPPSRMQPQINYYNGLNLSPEMFHQPAPPKVSEQVPKQPLYYMVNQQAPNQRPNVDTYSHQSPNLYKPSQLPFNASFYQSLNPAALNNEFYQAVGNNSQITTNQQQNIIPARKQTTLSQRPREEQSVQLVYVPVENLKNNRPSSQQSTKYNKYGQETVASNAYQQKANQISNFKPSEQIKEDSLSYHLQNTPSRDKLTSTFEPIDQSRQEQLVYNPAQLQQQQRTEFQSQQTNAPTQEKSSPSLVDQPIQEQLIYNPSQLQQQHPELNYQQIDSPRQEKLVADFRPGQESPISNSPKLLQHPTFHYQQVAPAKQERQDKQQRLENIQQDFVQKALQAHKLQQQLQDDINPLNQEPITTTIKPNVKPHQPPLAVFMESDKKAEISDVLEILKGAKTISVQDSVTPNSPKIFVGPSNLDSPGGYTKFPLPYLNNINGNRIERKIEQLPFFVAPVSYRAPPGYSKISLPSPHVGSVVVSVPFTSSTTPDPFNNHNLNLFTSSGTIGYSPDTNSKPTQNYFDNYENYNQGRYSTTPTSHLIDSPSIAPVRNIFESQFTSPQPEVYYTPSHSQQPYEETVTPFDIYNSPDNTRYSSREEQRSSTPRPTEDVQGNSQLPNVNPLELAINEFELHQINNQFEQPNKKVKHSTTRRPQIKSSYEDSQTLSSTRAPTSRGRQSYHNDFTTTQKSESRANVRGRGRSRTTTTTTTTTTSPKVAENGRYTILEEFDAREPNRVSSTESYGRFSAEAETITPRRSSTPVNSKEYLPEKISIENSYPYSVSSEPSRSEVEFGENRPQTDFDGRYDGGNAPSQLNLEESYKNGHPQVNYENVRTQTQFDEGPVTGRPNYDIKPLTFSDDNTENKFENIQSQSREAAKPKSQPVQSSDHKNSNTANQYQNQFYQENSAVENIPASVYNLREPQTYDNTAFDFDASRDNSDHIKQTDINSKLNHENTMPSQNHRFKPEVVSYESSQPKSQGNSREQLGFQEADSSANSNPDVGQSFLSETYQQHTPTERPSQRPKLESIDDHAAFLENLYQPNFDQTYLSLQDQAVRSLLTPNLLAPSRQTHQHSGDIKEQAVSSSKAVDEQPSSTEAEVTTTTRATRTRGRGRSRLTTPPSVLQRRPASRRRPISRTTTDRTASPKDYSSRESSEKHNVRQNFRNRGRPIQNEISDRISTTENDVKAFKQPRLEGGFEALSDQGPPQSYMQFEHAIDEQQIITINPELSEELQQYHQASTTEHVLEYENTKLRPSNVVDVQVTHVLPDEVQTSSDIITKPMEEEQYVRYNGNMKSGGVFNNNKPVTTTRAPNTKVRGRTRGRSRFATTTIGPTTKPATRTTTEEIEERESYGFIRQPDLSQRNIQAIPSDEEEKNVQFVGEIRPKYTPRKTTEAPQVDKTSKPRIRARTRAPSRKTTVNYRQSDNDGSRSTEQVTRRSGTTRGRVRGSTHYKAPDYQKRESDDEDVANQNYPINFLQKLDASSPKPTTAAFQITVDPLDHDDEDQSPHSSIHRPKYVYKTDRWSDPNTLSDENKPVESQKPEDATSVDEAALITEEPHALPMTQTTENNNDVFTRFTDSEASNVMQDLERFQTMPTEQTMTTELIEEPTTRQKNERRGAWKLVRQRPIDPLEVSESQNYQSVLNVFNNIEKIDPYEKSNSPPEKDYDKQSYDKDFKYDSFNQDMDSLRNDEFQSKDDVVISEVTENETAATTTTAEYTTETLSDDTITTTPSAEKTQENIFDTIYEMFGIFNKPEPSTNHSSTESLEKNVVSTTTITPVFPEEITEESPTTTTEESPSIIDADDKKVTSDDKTESATLESTTKAYEVEPWKMRAVKTSTSTEVSHETEICYKGRCVKTKDKKKFSK